jgi:hypothetical protein
MYIAPYYEKNWRSDFYYVSIEPDYLPEKGIREVAEKYNISISPISDSPLSIFHLRDAFSPSKNIDFIKYSSFYCTRDGEAAQIYEFITEPDDFDPKKAASLKEVESRKKVSGSIIKKYFGSKEENAYLFRKGFLDGNDVYKKKVSLIGRIYNDEKIDEIFKEGNKSKKIATLFITQKIHPLYYILYLIKKESGGITQNNANTIKFRNFLYEKILPKMEGMSKKGIKEIFLRFFQDYFEKTLADVTNEFKKKGIF